ncbi:MAG: hypothetical protein P8I93_03460 [Crocinitomicaceae bacterium]|nr:hypothetical protein [Crocinitomicaceae bacterium]
MKINTLHFFFLFQLFFFNAFSQKVAPFLDFNNYFRSFENNNFRTLEFQRIEEFKAGDDLVAYIDNRGNLRVYDGKERKDISNLNVEYKISDHLMAYKIGPTLNLWDEGKLKTLTYFARNYIVKDSMIVYEDTRFNTINVYWNKKTFTLYTSTGDLQIPDINAVGDNILAFKDNGDFYKIFWNGEIYELGVWSQGISFKAGCGVICFNDPTTRTFALFSKGEFIDIEDQYMPSYKAGRGFIAYEDLNGNLWQHDGEQRSQLSNYSPSHWDVKDDITIWYENSYAFARMNGKNKQTSTYIPKDYKLKNNVFAFRNIMGGVSAFINNEVVELTNQNDAAYQIYGNLVLLKLFNNNVVVYKDGQKFQN